MLVVFTLCRKDAAQALKVAEWMRELGPQKQHDCIMTNPRNMNKFEESPAVPAFKALQDVFNKVDVFIPWDEDEREWPYPANHMFTRVCQEIEWNRGGCPFLWMEPDAIPIKPGWLDAIEKEFQACGKVFMGDYVNLPNIAPHGSGIGVYSHMTVNANHYAHLDRLAFDVALAGQILANHYTTPLIQHEWKPEPFRKREDLNRLRPEAVIYHQDKSGSLIDVLKCADQIKGLDFKAVASSGSRESTHGTPANSEKARDDFGEARVSEMVNEISRVVYANNSLNHIELRKAFARAASESRLLGTGTDPLFEAQSIPAQIRHHVEALKTVVDGKAQRKALLRNALRMAGLIGAGKKRK